MHNINFLFRMSVNNLNDNLSKVSRLICRECVSSKSLLREYRGLTNWGLGLQPTKEEVLKLTPLLTPEEADSAVYSHLRQSSMKCARTRPPKFVPQKKMVELEGDLLCAIDNVIFRISSHSPPKREYTAKVAVSQTHRCSVSTVYGLKIFCGF